ncbi:MAG: UDP-3-O-(3-hydroxymyristoyl)glucosamine N-acyltransferase [Candidatus Eremiobacteraeota bacterium]|nr:UDP-3-O-(3-hydroxymyristoyl)glucosamine N-acyltransferase [Candidatus Eremiobacteraeota bacterium]
MKPGEPDVAARDLGTLEEIATRLEGKVVDVSHANHRVLGIAAIDEAREGQLTFATDARYLRAALASKAGAILTEERAVRELGERPGKPLIVVESTRSALATLLRAYAPARPSGTHIDPSAVIDPSATLGPDAIVGANAVIGREARIGARATLGAGVVIGQQASLGDDAILHPRALFLDRCIAGNRLIMQAGAIVGSDGFGYVFGDEGWVKIPQVGTVVIGDDVEIGANSCVDRAQTGATRIGDGTKIDNLVQIGHNCRLGRAVAIAGHSGLAGSTNVGDGTRMGGMVGTRGHITIGARVTIAGSSMIWSDVPDGAFVSGHPAQDHRAQLRWQASLRKVPKLLERVDALERKSQ